MRRSAPRWRTLPFALLLTATPAAAADTSASRADDPLERMNRTTYLLNTPFLASPASGSASTYERAVPPAVRQGIDNFFINLREPVAAAAALVAGTFGTAWNAASRFAINSTVGVLGFRDVAAARGAPSERSDLGLELCRNGFMREPIFIELPILGPADLRDISAQIVTNVALYTLVGRMVFYPYYVLDRLDMYYQRSVAVPAVQAPTDDPYIAQRDGYLDRRRQLCDALTKTVDRH
jgi:phospholipid-binding lipoprotein MlaA